MYFFNFVILLYLFLSPNIGRNSIDSGSVNNDSPTILMIENGPQTVCVGESVKFNALLLSEDEKTFQSSALNWTSTNENVGMIDEEGVFVSNNPGETLIKVELTTEDSVLYDEVPVKVKCSNIIKVNPAAIMDCAGKTKTLEIESNNLFSFIFRSSDSKIAEVDSNGQVFLKRKGECSIYILSETGRCFKEIPVIVL